MNKTKLLELLNKAPDSINLHDATLCGFCWKNDTVVFTIVIGEYHFLINGLSELVDDVDNDLILTLRFDGLNNIECGFYDDFRVNYAEIMDNTAENEIFKINCLDGSSVGKMAFQYKSFSWEIVGEFNSEQIKEWYKANGIYFDEEK